MRLDLTRGAGALVVVAVVAARKSFSVTAFSRSSFISCNNIGTDFRAMAIKGNDNTADPCSSVEVLDSTDLRRYYEKTKRILLLHGSNSSPGDANQGGDGNNRVEDAETAFSSLSLEQPPVKTRYNNSTIAPVKAFSLQHLEPRHRKSMMRCVLNSSSSKNSESEARTTIISKADFQHRLRLVNRKQKWKMTRLLLFGQTSVDVTTDASTSSNNDVVQQQHQYWWEYGIIREEHAPGLVDGIRGYLDSCYNNHLAIIDETKDDPKKFLSRLARGRIYKGNFRTLLEDYVATSSESEEKPISLYDKISGSGGATSKSSCEETNQRELELLHLFIDELEEDAEDAEAANYKDNKDHNNNPASKETEPSKLLVGAEQISLLRTICELDVFSSAPPPKSVFSSPSGGPVFDDGGQSVGKKGERDLETYLVGKHCSSSDLSTLFPPTRVLSPVWVRPKHKNRRNTKQKCKCVLEIPRMTNAENSSSSKTKTNGFVSQGTTSEFDAMVVRVIQRDTNDDDDDNDDDESEGGLLPIMAIREVWDAKATLDPSALIDVLDKKANSLRKILRDKNSNVVNISDVTSTTVNDRDCDDGKTAHDGANFVLYPVSGTKNNNPSNGNTDSSATDSDTSPVPMVYRVGIEPNNEDDNDHNRDDCDGYQDFPQIGVFASKMISPGAAARRIQTIVYERLLETDLSTVKGVVLMHKSRCHDTEQDKNSGDDPLRCNQLVRDRSLEIVERILKLIETLRPIAVVGRLPSNG
jgi:hypothetical protein